MPAVALDIILCVLCWIELELQTALHTNQFGHGNKLVYANVELWVIHSKLTANALWTWSV